MTRTMTPLRAIRKKCIDCCCGEAKEVKLCDMTTCSLWPYRNGKKPKNEKLIADESKYK